MNYKVTLATTTVDKLGISKSDNQEFNFSNENIMTARREAISKAKELIAEYDCKEEFVSPAVAQDKGYKDYSSYSVAIYFGEDDLAIFGEQDIEALQEEAQFILNNSEEELDTFVDDETDYELLEEDFDFLMN